MCRIGKIKNSNVAGVNLSGIGIFVNQSIESKKDEAQTPTSTKVYAVGIVRGWTMIWVIVSSLLSIGAIVFCCACLPRIVSDINPRYDYLGIIIGVLALFITFLVAWNIWATITTKEEIKKLTEAADKLDTLEIKLNKQRALFENRNLEIRNLIDAHTKISEAEKIKDLHVKYTTYAEALDLLLQSNVGISYERFDLILQELTMITTKFSKVDNLEDAWNIIASEDEFIWHYKNLIAKLEQRSDEIESLRRELTLIKELREAAIKDLKMSDIGKQALRVNAELSELRKQLETKYAARQAAEAKNAP